jgi:hypothetical protein
VVVPEEGVQRRAHDLAGAAHGPSSDLLPLSLPSSLVQPLALILLLILALILINKCVAVVLAVLVIGSVEGEIG